jgi:hypothetical protein
MCLVLETSDLVCIKEGGARDTTCCLLMASPTGLRTLSFWHNLMPSSRWQSDPSWNRGGSDNTAAWRPYRESRRVLECVGCWEQGKQLLWTAGGDAVGTTDRLLLFSCIEQCILLFFRTGTQRSCVEFIPVSRLSEHSSLSPISMSIDACSSITEVSFCLLPRPIGRATLSGLDCCWCMCPAVSLYVQFSTCSRNWLPLETAGILCPL